MYPTPNYIGSVAGSNQVFQVTRGCGISFSVTLTDKNTGNPVDFSAAVYIDVDVPSAANPTRTQAASISGNIANMVVPFVVCDQVTNNTNWRLAQSNGADDPAPQALMTGTFSRND
jgi:hypothetical protein